MEKVIRDGNVAVLFSPGYGAGWSTWNDKKKEAFVFDRRFVEAKESGQDTDFIIQLCKEIFGDEYICVLGWSQVQICWLPVGTKFEVDEYDGYESIRELGEIEFLVA